MKIRWEMSASTAYDQMPEAKRRSVNVALHRLAGDNHQLRPELKTVLGIAPFNGRPVKSMRASDDLRVLVAITPDTVHVIDIVRREQLRRLGG
jgi:hypothetical protein